MFLLFDHGRVLTLSKGCSTLFVILRSCTDSSIRESLFIKYGHKLQGVVLIKYTCKDGRCLLLKVRGIHLSWMYFGKFGSKYRNFIPTKLSIEIIM